MEIIKKYDEKELTISVKGRIDTLNSEDLNKEIHEEIGKFDSLIMDFTDLEYISSAGLRVLVSTKKELKPNNIPFVIKNTNGAVREIFRMSGLNKILQIE